MQRQAHNIIRYEGEKPKRTVTRPLHDGVITTKKHPCFHERDRFAKNLHFIAIGLQQGAITSPGGRERFHRVMEKINIT